MNGGYVIFDTGLSASIYEKIIYLRENPSTSPYTVEYRNAYEIVRKFIETKKPILMYGGNTTQAGAELEQLPIYVFGDILKDRSSITIGLTIYEYVVNFKSTEPNKYTILK